MRFTVADVEKFKSLLNNAEPTYHRCMPPSDQLSPPPLDTCYTLYSVHKFNEFLKALNKDNEHMGRYVLTATGQLCFGREGQPGKYIPEHWQMSGEETMIIAAGNIFVKDGKITSLNDQSSSPTGLLSLIYTLRALHNSELPLAMRLELIQSTPDHNGEYSAFMTRADLQNIIGYHADSEHDTDDELLEEEIYLDLDNIREPAKLSERAPTPHPSGRFGLFYNQTTDENINIKLRQPPNYELTDAPETKTTTVVAPTW
ncbi:MAG: hypothetical protein P1U36_09035 [Legionellaceae bacterium]|nr:hypothetical protein [Legionellaceae bacterium]